MDIKRKSATKLQLFADIRKLFLHPLQISL